MGGLAGVGRDALVMLGLYFALDRALRAFGN